MHAPRVFSDTNIAPAEENLPFYFAPFAYTVALCNILTYFVLKYICFYWNSEI